jgi:hypothetical protein
MSMHKGVLWQCTSAASNRGHDSVVTLLLEKGLMSMYKGVHMAMHFMQLRNRGHDSVVTLLLEKGADVNHKGVTMAMHFRQLLQRS